MNKFMEIALNEALKGMNKNEGGPFGAVIIKKGKIIAKAHNTVLKSNDSTAHAEINAIRIASKKINSFDLSECEIYSVCEPCPMCFSAIMWSKIKKIYFGCSKQEAERIGFNDKKIYDEIKGKRKTIKLKKINEKECFTVFKEWEKKKNKKMY
jgi:guanine deaminase